MSDAPILTPFLDDADVILYAGDCIDVMRRMPEASVDAIVTDPPYGLEFMGKEWDAFKTDKRGVSRNGESQQGDWGWHLGRPSSYDGGHAFQSFSEGWAREAFRVLKPGGHLLAFAGTRTYHRMAAGVEDAGFEIRDCIAWMYGSGFPKSLDVSKAIDKAAGAERETRVYTKSPTAKAANMQANGQCGDCGKWKFSPDPCRCPRDNGPQTDAAREWSGWGTALKPAFEPVVVARKPLTGTVAQNVLEHGTGALNIDACRIGTDGGRTFHTKCIGDTGSWFGNKPTGEVTEHGGRWPANVALDDAAASMLDEQSGESATPATVKRGGRRQQDGWGMGEMEAVPCHGDRGGASRFFYTAKASRQDRNVGGLANNTHPTVKPTDLMRWLIRLVTPPGGIILDPFGGSGSTGLAARAENVRCILIEREPEYLEIIRDRLAQLSLLSELLDDE